MLLRAGTGSGFADHVVLTSDSGALVTQENGWTYAVAGAVSSVVPPTGQLDAWVTIRGSSLRGGSGAVVNVTLAGNAARIVSEADGVVVVVASASTGSVGTDVVLVGSSGSLVMLGGGWMYATEGVVAAVAPSSGQHGTVVSITGARLRGNGSAVTQVTLNGVTARIVSQMDDVVQVEAGHGTAGVGAVVLTSSTNATVSRGSVWQYLPEGNISQVVPAIGQIGTRVTIRGRRMVGGGGSVVDVLLGGVSVQQVVMQNDTYVVVQAARGSAMGVAGSVVVVADSGAMVSGAGMWQYVAEGTISAVEPSIGQVGTVVVIRGSGLLGAGARVVSVTLAGVAASVALSTDTVVNVVAGLSATAGVGAVVLTSDTGAVVSVGGTARSRTWCRATCRR